MIKISKRAQYGLRAMVFLARNASRSDASGLAKNKPISAKTISEKEAIPFEFLEKIILQMEKAGLVKSKKGVRGGYVLSFSPNKISAKDIVSVLEENKKPVNCALCGRKNKCSAKNVWAKLDTALNKTLAKITLSELI